MFNVSSLPLWHRVAGSTTIAWLLLNKGPWDANCWGGSFFNLGTGWVFNTTSMFVNVLMSLLVSVLTTQHFHIQLCSYQICFIWFEDLVILYVLPFFVLIIPFLWLSSNFVYLFTMFLPVQFGSTSDTFIPRCEKSVIWPSFCLSVSGSSDIPRHHGDMTIPNDPQFGCVYIPLLFWGWS